MEIKRHKAWALLLERAELEVSRVFGEPTELRPIEKKRRARRSRRRRRRRRLGAAAACTAGATTELAVQPCTPGSLSFIFAVLSIILAAQVVMFLVLACLFALSGGMSIVSTLAGGGASGQTASGYADGIGRAALFQSPTSVAYFSGSLFITDTQNLGDLRFSAVIRQIDINSATVTSLIGGTSIYNHCTDGVGSSAALNPNALVADSNAGIIYFTDYRCQSIRAVNIAAKTVDRKSVV